ncbi:MAG: PAS domain-containing protein, partial [Bradyrhizobium sp.]|nr:PAS domain-containing protein [Bradyrhizobium sp.]
MTGLSESDIRTDLMASAGPAPSEAAAPRSEAPDLRRALHRKPTLVVALGSTMVTATAITMLLDKLISELLAPYPTIFAVGEIVVLVVSTLAAMGIYLLMIGRPIKQLAESVQRLAERSDDSSLMLLHPQLRELAQLVDGVLSLRARLIADEQRAMRLASDMIQVAKASGDWLWREDANHRFIEFLNVNAAAESQALIEKRLGMTRREVANHPDDQAALAELQKVLDARGTFRDFRYRRIEPDGAVRWYSTSGVPIYNEKDEFVGYRGTSRDITPEAQIMNQQSSLVMLNSRLAAAIGQ